MNDEDRNRSGAKGSCGGARPTLVRIGERPSPLHWKSPDELVGQTRPKDEFPGGVHEVEGGGIARRDFLSLMGFSLAAASLSGCRGPVHKAIPLLVASDRIVPGKSTQYATTCRGCP